MSHELSWLSARSKLSELFDLVRHEGASGVFAVPPSTEFKDSMVIVNGDDPVKWRVEMLECVDLDGNEPMAVVPEAADSPMWQILPLKDL